MEKNKVKTLLIELLGTVCLIGCDVGPGDRAPIHENELFQYIYLKENGTKHKNLKTNEIVIVGFTEAGKKCGSLDIPFSINGYPVTKLGIEDQSFSYNHNWIVEPGENLKKMYIHENINEIVCRGAETTLFICTENNDYRTWNTTFKEIFCPRTWFEDTSKTQFGQYTIANTTFFLNPPSGVEVDDIYRIENLANNETITRPLDPTIEGCTFTGWYTEKECINSWDFNTTVNFEDLDVLNLYAGWQRI